MLSKIGMIEVQVLLLCCFEFRNQLCIWLNTSQSALVILADQEY